MLDRGLGDDRLPTTRTAIRNPIGSSMGFTRRALKLTGGFSTDLGRVGTHPVGAEETELAIRLRQADPSARIMLVPDAVVHHRVSPNRLAFAYYRSRCYWEGVSKALITENVGTDRFRENGMGGGVAFNCAPTTGCSVNADCARPNTCKLPADGGTYKNCLP